MDPPSKINC